MKNLIEPKNTIEVLKKYNLSFKKRFGQNFLIDSHVLHKIIESAELSPEDVVLEIGPGIGTLTEALAERAGKVYAIEIDSSLIPILTENLSDYDNVIIRNEDILKTDIFEIANTEKKKLKVVANLPYYITTPILMELMEKKIPVESITVMVQKEVALRMAASPGTKDYGALSLAVQYYGEPYLVANVPMNSFMPRPDVTSAVIRISLYEKPPVEVTDEKKMFDIIHAAFQTRRKILLNGLKNRNYFGHTKEEALEAILTLGKGPDVRGETLSLAEFAALSDRL